MLIYFTIVTCDRPLLKRSFGKNFKEISEIWNSVRIILLSGLSLIFVYHLYIFVRKHHSSLQKFPSSLDNLIDKISESEYKIFKPQNVYIYALKFF